jgi:predicted amidohydrolase
MAIVSLHSLLFETTSSYEANLQTLLELIKKVPDGGFIVAPEVCLTGYDYENFDAMLTFGASALGAIKEASKNKTVLFTALVKEDGVVKNNAYVFHNQRLIHKQPKVKLFRFGEEHNYVSAGKEEEIIQFEIDGVRIGILICFEIRFKHFWQKLEGADIIAVPSWWGILRERNYKVLTEALAIMNQCYVVCSDSQNAQCTRQSGVITPFGIAYRNEGEPIASLTFNPKEIQKMRRYMDVGIE